MCRCGDVQSFISLENFYISSVLKFVDIPSLHTANISSLLLQTTQESAFPRENAADSGTHIHKWY